MAHQFGARLRQLRSEWGLLQRELEELLLLRPGSVSQYERGLREPGFDLLIAIADELDVGLDYLLGRSREEQASPALLAGRSALNAALRSVSVPAEVNVRLALLLTQAEQVNPVLFALPKLARLLTVSAATLKACREGAGGLSPSGREKLVRHLGVGPEWSAGA